RGRAPRRRSEGRRGRAPRRRSEGRRGRAPRRRSEGRRGRAPRRRSEGRRGRAPRRRSKGRQGGPSLRGRSKTVTSIERSSIDVPTRKCGGCGQDVLYQFRKQKNSYMPRAKTRKIWFLEN